MVLTLAMLLTATPLKVASTTWESSGVEAKLTEVLEGRFIQLLREAGLQVTSPKDMTAILGLERQKQLLGCGTDSCTAELAGALGVDAILSASIVKAGSGYTASLRAISATNGAPLSALSERVKNIDALQDWLDTSARQMAAELSGRPTVTSSSGPGLVRWIPAISGAVVGVGGLVLFLERAGPANELQTRVFPDQSAVANTRATGEALEKIGITLMAVGGAAIATSVLWVALTPPETPRVTLAPIPGGAAVSIGGEFP